MKMPGTICVTGGGPAGLMAAIAAARAGSNVTVLDHSGSAGTKLLLTGGGRCNITCFLHSADFVRLLGPKGRFLGHALASMSPGATREFFGQAGVPTTVEADGRVVPVSQRAVDVRRALLEMAATLGVRLQTSVDVTGIKRLDDGWAVTTGSGSHRFDKVILATGGMSYASTGSDGSGYRLATALGHTLTRPVPAEVPLISADLDTSRLQGLSVEPVAISINADRRPRTRGSLLFTHFGLSGPAVLDISGDVSRMLDEGTPVTLSIDLLPDTPAKEVDEMLQSDPRCIQGRLPSRLAAFLKDGAISDWRPGRPNPIKRFTVKIARTRGFDHAMVTRGGIVTGEIDPATMQSRLHPGLFFAGEILDLDGPMGGFNLQIAWATGHLAGTSASAG